MKWLISAISLVAFAALSFWFYHDRSMESLGACLAALAAFLGTLLVPKLRKAKSENLTMKQKGVKGSKNYQAGESINITK